MRTLLLALLLFFATSAAVQAEKPDTAISFAFDMSGSMHDDSISGLLPAELQLSALKSAFQTLATQDLECAHPFQMQIIFWGDHERVILEWTIVEGDRESYQAIAQAVGALGISNHNGTDHTKMQETLNAQLTESDSENLLGVITTNEGTNPSVIQHLQNYVLIPSVRLYGVSINNTGGALLYLSAITQTYSIARSHLELQDWFVALLQDTVAPKTCLMS